MGTPVQLRAPEDLPVVKERRVIWLGYNPIREQQV
jgi:hypothetical protein